MQKNKLTTGWERGADGKLRYEIEDFDIDNLGRQSIKNAKHKWIEELDELNEKIFLDKNFTSVY